MQKTMRRVGLGVAAVGATAALALPAAPAQAAPYSSGSVSSPSPNTVVYTVNNLTDSNRSCRVFLSGAVSYDSPDKRIPPKSTLKYTLVDVPAGNYSTWWACNSFANGKTLVTVTGKSTGKPRLATAAPAPTNPLNDLLQLFGS